MRYMVRTTWEKIVMNRMVPKGPRTRVYSPEKTKKGPTGNDRGPKGTRRVGGVGSFPSPQVRSNPRKKEFQRGTKIHRPGTVPGNSLSLKKSDKEQVVHSLKRKRPQRSNGRYTSRHLLGEKASVRARTPKGSDPESSGGNKRRGSSGVFSQPTDYKLA